MKHTIFRARELRAHLPAAALGIVALMALGANARAATLTGNAALTSDYVWRGTTQTRGDAAVQAGFRLAGESGFYGSVWGSNVDAPDTHASSEFDFSLGWAGNVGDDWALDVNVLRYQYPSTTVDLNWTELNATATWAGNYWVALAWSPEALGSEEAGAYGQFGVRFPINDALRIEAAAGYYWLDRVYGDNYAHGQLSAIWAVTAPLELRLTAHATDSGAERIFGDDLAGDRIEAAVQASF